MRCILHIGSEKTGTTSLQNALSRESSLLASQGFHYLTFDSYNARSLAASVMDYDRVDYIHLHKRLNTLEKRRGFRKKIVRRLRQQVSYQKATGVDCFLISAEHFHSSIVRESEIKTLRRILMSLFDDIDIVLYLRPQIDVAVSYYSTRLVSGELGEEILPDQFNEACHYFNYLFVYRLWADGFGEEAVMVRDYTSIEDVALDFFNICGIEGVTAGRENNSLNAGQLGFLKAINYRLPPSPDGTPNRLRARILPLIKGAPGRNLPLISRPEAVSFQRKFDRCNSDLLDLIGDGRRQLFHIDFNKYPPEIYEVASSEDVLDTFVYALGARFNDMH